MYKHIAIETVDTLFDEGKYDLNERLARERVIPGTKILVIDSGTSLTDIFGEMSVSFEETNGRGPLKKIEDRTIPIERIQSFFMGISRLVLCGHDENRPFLDTIKNIESNPPYLVYQGQRVDLDHPIELVPIKALHSKALPANKLEKIIAAFHSVGMTDEVADLAMVTNQALSNLAKDHNVNVSRFYKKAFLEKIARQVLLERDWDRSTGATNYHIGKALCSLLTKEARHPKTMALYEAMKSSIWNSTGYPEYTKPKPHEKSIEDLLLQHIHSKKWEPKEDGYHKWIATVARLGSLNAVKKHLHPAPLPRSLYRTFSEIFSPKEKTHPDVVSARLFRKETRLAMKLERHGLVSLLGPTGTGKSEAGILYAREKFKDCGGIQPGLNFFRITVGEGVDGSNYFGSAKLSEDRRSVIFEEGIVTQWAKSTVEGRLLLIDEATLVENWESFGSILRDRRLWVNGEEIEIKGNPVILVTGNQSEGGRYSGRYNLDELFREHGAVMTKKNMTADELQYQVLAPCLQGSESTNRRMSKALIDGFLYIRDQLGISQETIGSRELRHVAALSMLYIEQGEEHPETAAFTAWHRTLSGYTDPTTLHQFDRHFDLKKLADQAKVSTENTEQNSMEILRSIAEFEALNTPTIDRPSRIFGAKAGMILPESEQERILAQFKSDSIIVHPTDSYEEAVDKISAAYTAGCRLIILAGNYSFSSLLEPRINEKLTEPTQGFHVYLFNSPHAQIASPALQSRCLTISQASTKTEDPITTSPQKKSHSPTIPIEKESSLKRLEKWIAAPVALALSPFIEITRTITMGLSIVSGMESHAGENKTSSTIPTVDSMTLDNEPAQDFEYYPKTDPSYNRTAVYPTLEISEGELKSALCIKNLQEQPVDKIPSKETPGNLSNPIPLCFDKNGYSKVTSATSDQEILRYRSNPDQNLKFFKDRKTQEWFVQIDLKIPKRKWPKTLSVVTNIHASADLASLLKKTATTALKKGSQELVSPMDPAQKETLRNRLIDLLRKQGFVITPEAPIHTTLGTIRRYLHSFSPQFSFANTFYFWLHSDPLMQQLRLMETRLGVCRHTATTGKLLCDILDIPSQVVCSNGHQWLEVGLNVQGKDRLIRFETLAGGPQRSETPPSRVSKSQSATPPPVKRTLKRNPQESTNELPSIPFLSREDLRLPTVGGVIGQTGKIYNISSTGPDDALIEKKVVQRFKDIVIYGSVLKDSTLALFKAMGCSVRVISEDQYPYHDKDTLPHTLELPMDRTVVLDMADLVTLEAELTDHFKQMTTSPNTPSSLDATGWLKPVLGKPILFWHLHYLSPPEKNAFLEKLAQEFPKEITQESVIHAIGSTNYFPLLMPNYVTQMGPKNFEQGENVTDTILTASIRRKDTSVALDLIEKRKDLLSFRNSWGTQALTIAIAYLPDIANMLIPYGAGLNSQTVEGRTALMIAIKYRHKDIAKTLIDAGADTDIQNIDGCTALMVDINLQNGYSGNVRMMIDAGADLNIQNKEGYTALILTCRNFSGNKFKMLIDAGADLNIQDKLGRTALMHAIYARNIGKVKMLIHAGADLGIADKDGSTALDIARSAGRQDIVDLLM